VTRGGDPGGPLRWERDSKAEGDEAHRASEIDKLARWAREQRLRPLTDALEAHGITRDDREGWGRYIVPSWWPRVPPPETACPWCESPGDGHSEICEGCLDAQAAAGDPPSMIAWWRSLAPIARRLHLGAVHGIDPWTGRAVTISYEDTTIDPEAGVAVSCLPLRTLVPRTSWDEPPGSPGDTAQRQ
jgi:hypothetical protein